MTINKIGVLGAGTMGGGSGIAHLAALRGFEVVLYCMEQCFVESAVKRISGLIDRRIRKQKMTVEEKETILNRITFTTNMEDLAPVDMVIEAIFDDIGIKKSAFEKIDGICGAETIFCSNTSNISITDLASATSRPDKVVGLKFLNPPQIMRQVEVIRGHHTSDETVALATKMAQALGKKVTMLLGEPLRLMNGGLDNPEEIEMAKRISVNYPIGSHELIYSGLEVSV